MFTYVVDEAIHRFEHDGVEYSVGYDECPPCPTEWLCDIDEIGFRSYGRCGYNYFDHKGLWEDMHTLEHDKETGIIDIEDIVYRYRSIHGAKWWEHLEEEDAELIMEAMADIDYFNYALSEFHVIKDGRCEAVYRNYEEQRACSDLEIYKAWADGEVYAVCNESTGETVWDCYIDPFDEQQVIDCF
ncbi:hypothetical protein [Corynebacterium pyruviciproducens]|uniref:Uncharacterized protein n=1 Tax=Corynebacterium pyruviciproducens TaxID=598660 RepID=A0AAF0YU28_9CORY|nr:hypothetical protein [Corynebacterium pyruviciproducens]WOT03389.1 hypothetical protein CYJ47_06450 [Corynebacterium pyruviciproducens]